MEWICVRGGVFSEHRFNNMRVNSTQCEDVTSCQAAKTHEFSILGVK